MLKAVLWDVDGTLAETERDGHRVAFNRAFEALGLAWHWDVDRYGELLQVTGGRERLLHDMASRPDAPALVQERLELAQRLHELKNAAYAEIVRDGAIGLRPGVHELMESCRSQGLRMGIATTTSRSNVEALLQRQIGPAWRDHFAVVLCGEDTARKKPDPEVYDLAIHALAIDARDALAIEDSPAGAAAACAAGVPVVVTRSAYFAADPVRGAAAIGPGLHRRRGWTPAPEDDAPGSVSLADLQRWWQGVRAAPRARGSRRGS